MRPISIMDTTLRDAHQSLWATRMEIGDMLPILEKMDSVGYWSLEVWGGATFDAALRFLDENPWERLRTIKRHCPKTPLQMLLRGQNLVGYRHYSDEICRRFVLATKRNGIDIFRVFDALNDIRNVEVSARGHQGVRGPVRGRHLLHRQPGAHAGHLSRVRAAAQGARRRHDLHQGHGGHAHAVPHREDGAGAQGGDRPAGPRALPLHRRHGADELPQGVEAGADIVDTAVVALAFGNSQPAVEMIVAALKESPYDTGIDLDLLFEIAEYWEAVRERKKLKRGITTLL